MLGYDAVPVTRNSRRPSGESATSWFATPIPDPCGTRPTDRTNWEPAQESAYGPDPAPMKVPASATPPAPNEAPFNGDVKTRVTDRSAGSTWNMTAPDSTSRVPSALISASR